MKISLALVLVARAAAASLHADQAAVDLDTARTQVAFTLGGSLHTVHGNFKLKSGSISFDPSSGEAGGLLVVDAASGDSGGGARDRRMHKDILESEKFPEITFAPDRFEGQLAPEGDSEILLHGLFAIHGAAHPMTLKTHVHLVGDQLTATLHFAVPYMQWGMKNPSALFLRVSDTVSIDLMAAGRLKPALPTETRTAR